MSGYLKMSAFNSVKEVLISDYITLVGESKNKKISYPDFVKFLNVINSTDGGAPLFFEGTVLPSVDNTGEPLKKGNWVLLFEGTYTNPSITVPAGKVGFAIHNGTTFVLNKTVDLPVGASILNGAGVPTSGIGKIGDFYLDTTNTVLYGAKNAGGWGGGVALKASGTTFLNPTGTDIPQEQAVYKAIPSAWVAQYENRIDKVTTGNIGGTSVYSPTNNTSRIHYNTTSKADRDCFLHKIEVDVETAGTIIIVLGKQSDYLSATPFTKRLILEPIAVTVGYNEIVLDVPILKDEYVGFSGGTANLRYSNTSTFIPGHYYVQAYTTAVAPAVGIVGRGISYKVYTQDESLEDFLEKKFANSLELNGKLNIEDLTPTIIDQYDNEEIIPEERAIKTLTEGNYSSLNSGSRVHINTENKALNSGLVTSLWFNVLTAGTVVVCIGKFIDNDLNKPFEIRSVLPALTLTAGVNSITLEIPIELSKDEYIGLRSGTVILTYGNVSGDYPTNKFIQSSIHPATIGNSQSSAGVGFNFGYTMNSLIVNELKEKLENTFVTKEEFNPNLYVNKTQITQINITKEINGNNAVQDTLDTITDASINNRYVINVGMGLYKITNASQFKGMVGSQYTMVAPKSHVDIIGLSRASTILWAELPFDGANFDGGFVESDRTKFQTLFNNADDSLIKSITFVIVNGRYCLHQDNGLEANKTRRYEDCSFLFKGTKGYTRSLGLGTYTGSKTYLNGCEIVSPTREAFTIHNNKNFLKPSLWSFTNTSFINEDGTTSKSIAALYNSGSMQDCTIEMIGCTFNQSFILDYEEYWLYTANVNDCYNHANWRLIGYGNEPLFFKNTVIGKALKIKSNSTGLNSKVRFDNLSSAYSDIIANPYNYWGYLGHPDREIVDKYIVQDGAPSASGYAIGGKSIFEGSYYQGISLDSLGNRLGDCSAVNKKLVIEIDSVVFEVIFNKNYTSMSNASIIAEINTVIAGAGVASEHNVGGEYYAEFTDVLNIGLSASTINILPKGLLVTRKDGRIQACGENDELFGLLIDDCYPFRRSSNGINYGKGRVIKNCYVTIEAGKIQSVLNSGTGTRYKISAGQFVADANGRYTLVDSKYILI